MGTATITEWDLGRGVKETNGVDVTVDFDPKSLQLTYTPTGSTSAGASTESGTWSKAPAQQTGQSASLSVDLTFDTSTTGTSVQERTDPLVRLTRPGRVNESAPARRVVRFSWGSFLFFGTVQSLSETIDFFSDSGIPLRSAVHLTLAQVDPPNPASGSPASAPPSAFGANAGPGFSAGASASLGIGASASAGFGAAAGIGVSAGVGFGASAGASAGTTPLTVSQSGDTVQAIAARAGGGASWKAVAAANGIDNPRLLPPGTVLNAQARIA